MNLATLSISDRQFGRIVLAFVGLGFVGLLAGGAAAVLAMALSQDRTAWVTHSFEVERHIDAFTNALELMESSRRGYVISQDPLFRRTFDDARQRAPRELAVLARITADNPWQRESLHALTVWSQRLQTMLQTSMTDAALDGSSKAQIDFRTDSSVPLVREIRKLTTNLIIKENQLLSQRLADQKRAAAIFTAVMAASGVLLIVVASASFWVILRYTKDLASSRDSLRAINDHLEEAVDVRTADLKRANQEIQRFAYIVSHDLRSPLVNVLGFTAELEAAHKPIAALIENAEREAPSIVSEEVRAAVRDDVPEAIGFIRSSTQKMDRLINAILKLSREGRRTISPEPLDLDHLARTVADSLRHRVDAIGAEISIAQPLPPLTSDRLAVEQILSNLVENAVKYLAPGRPGRIRISGRLSLGRVILEVVDNGRGIDPKDHDRVFDLFRRSGAQDQPGEGIGLAHVRALAYRLGGIVACESELDQGATFRLSLPLNYSGDESI